MNILVRTWMAALLLVLSVAGPVAADLYFESEQVGRGVPGRPDGAAILKQYFTADIAMLDLGDRITIMNFKEGVFFELLKAAKTYTTGPLQHMRLQSLGIDTYGLEQNTLAQTVMQAVAQRAIVTPLGEEKTIGGYRCTNHRVQILMSDAIYWTTREIEGYEALKALAERSAAAFAENQLLQRMNILGLIKELNGYPVMTVTRLMGGTITNTLTRVERKPLDPELFKVPAGYSPAR
jgi:hypothetical protein